MTTLFGHTVRSDLLLLCVTEALVCFAAISVLLVWQFGVPADQSGVVAATIAIASGLVLGASGLYQPKAFGRTRRLLVGAGMLLFVLLSLLALLTPATSHGLRDHLVGIPLSFVGIVIATRLGFTAILRSGMLGRRIARVRGSGITEEPTQFDGAARDGGFNVVLDLSDDVSLADALDPARLRASQIGTIVAADTVTIPAPIRQRCETAGIRFFGETEFVERQLARIDVAKLPARWLAHSNAVHERQVEAALRRGFDILFGVILVLATLPLLVLTGVAIKLDSRGPVFYRQERVGRNGITFNLLKFRSMATNAEASGTPIWASKYDSRVTRVGRFIRLTRIDEIPQVLNVLRGDMAFVGPRPERPTFVDQLNHTITHYNDRAIVKPGITGWAQVNYPYGASVEDARMKLAYDLYYVKRRSIFLDILILIATVRVVLFQEGAR